jgi:histidyl-tRNA synthetase
VLRDRPEIFPALCVVIDKLDKIGADAVVEQLCDPAGAIRLPRPDAREVVAWLGIRELAAAAAAAPAGSGARADLERLFALLEAYGLADRVTFDASVVRGLAYYTGVVFEAFDAERQLRAICGGGRYDRLVETLGGPPIPAAGFGFGDAVIHELLALKQRLPELRRTIDAVVFPFGESERAAAIRLASRLRAEGQAVELVLSDVKPKRALADADRAGARRVYLLGPDELARGEVAVRDLATGEQSTQALLS